MIEKLKAWILRLSLNSLWEEEEEDDWEDFDMQDDYISGAEEDTEREAKSGVTPAIVYFVIVILLVMAALSYMVFSHRHLYTGYSVTESYEGADVIGTSYLKIGGNFFKYGSDGVSMVNGRNELIWSNAYTMQTPTVDFTGQTLLIYEQQGYQVYLVDGSGIIGNFITDLPIMRGEVADNGVTALLLKNDRDCLIRMYSREGTQIAEVKSTLEDSGYPTAFDISSDARTLMVALTRIGSGTVDSSIMFYDFSSASEADDEHFIGSISYKDQVFPEAFFANDRMPVAVGDSMIVVMSSGGAVSEKRKIHVDGEIISTFHGEDYIGLVLPSSDTENRYLLQVYRYNGKQTMSQAFNEGYSEISIDSGEILVYSQSHMMAFTPDGTWRLNSDFTKPIAAFAKIPGFRRYSVITWSGIYRIRAQ